MKRIVLLLAFIVMVFPATLFAQWHELPGPSAGAVNDFCEIAGSNGGEIYAATPNGVYRTMDHAKTWQLMGLRGQYIQKLTQYVTPDAEILFACLLPNGPYGSTASLCRSEDSGRTWDTIFVSIYSGGLESVQDGNDVILGIRGRAEDSLAGIYRSTDIGRTWTHQALAPSSNGSMEDFIIGGNSIFCITSSTTQGGDTIWTMPSHGSQWKSTSYPFWHRPNGIEFFGNDLFVSGKGRIDISTDNGVTWLNPPNVGLDTTSDNLYSFAVNGLTIVAAGNRDVYRSTDGASSWQRVDGTGGYPHYPYLDDMIYSDEITFIDNKFFSATLGGALSSSDGISWAYAGGIPGGPGEIASDGSTLFASTLRGIFRSTDRGQTWIIPSGSRDLVDSDGMILHSINGRVYASGETISARAPALWRWDDSEWDVLTDSTIYNMTADSAALFASTNEGIIRSTDNGITWTPQSNSSAFSGGIPMLAANGLVFAFVKTFTGEGEVLSSNDEGDSWNLIDSLQALAGAFSVTYASNKIYIVTGWGFGGLFFSSDYGLTWDSVTIGEPYSIWPLASGVVVETRDEKLYLVNGVSISLLADSSLSPYFGEFASDDSFAYVVGNQGHIYAEPLTSLPLAVTPSPIAPASLSLSVFPNPTNGVSTISFTLPKRENISLKLFDERGVNRATYFDGISGPGEIQFPIDAAGLSAGSYIAVLTTREGTAVARVAILPK